jgi:arylsulfatase A-like enzyme
MKHRWWLWASVAVIGAVIVVGAATGFWRGLGHRGPDRFVLIVVDSLRADHVGCYGSSKGLTPNIDAFARESIRFTNAYPAASYTLGSNAALLTGKYPHEVRDERPWMVASGATTLPEYLHAANYQTAAFSAHFIISSHSNFQQGFDVFMHADRADDAVVTRCCNWLARHHKERYFVLAYLWDPHLPYRSKDLSPEVRAKLPHVRAPVRTGEVPLSADIRRPRLTPNPSDDTSCSPEEVQVLHALYDGAIRQADRRVGRILKEIGDDPGTAVALVADHGEEWLDHGGLRHMLTLYDELLHVPFILRVPGEAPRVIDTPVSTLDLTPTFLALAGLRRPADLRGRPLTGRIEARPVLSECGYVIRPDTLRYGVRLGDETLIYTVSDLPKEPAVPAGGVWERYDLARDPHQRVSLAVDSGSEAYRLLRDYYREAQKSLQPSRRAQPKVLDEDLLKKLRALGYTAR